MAAPIYIPTNSVGGFFFSHLVLASSKSLDHTCLISLLAQENIPSCCFFPMQGSHFPKEESQVQRRYAPCPVTRPVSGAAGVPAWRWLPRAHLQHPCSSPACSMHSLPLRLTGLGPGSSPRPMPPPHTAPSTPQRRLATPALPSPPGHQWMPQTFLRQVVRGSSAQHHLGACRKGSLRPRPRPATQHLNSSPTPGHPPSAERSDVC